MLQHIRCSTSSKARGGLSDFSIDFWILAKEMGWEENALRGAFLNSLNEMLSPNKLPRSLDALISMCVRIDMQEYDKQVASSRWFQDGGGILGTKPRKRLASIPCSPTFALRLEETAMTPSPWESQLLLLECLCFPSETHSRTWIIFFFSVFFSISISCGADRLGYMVLIFQLLCCCGSVFFTSLLIPKFYLLESKWISQGKLYVALFLCFTWR